MLIINFNYLFLPILTKGNIIPEMKDTGRRLHLTNQLTIDREKAVRAAEEMIAQYGDSALAEAEKKIGTYKSEGFDYFVWKLIREFVKDTQQSAPTTEGHRKDDDAHLRRLWQSNLAIEEIAQELQRTPASIYGRVRILDLSSSKRDTKNEKKPKIELPGSDRRSPTVISKAGNGIEGDAPKIDSPRKSSER
jgi:hypothetical protein